MDMNKKYDLNAMGFDVDKAREGELKEAFIWSEAPEGFSYWSRVERDGITPEAQYKLDAMIAQWEEEKTPKLWRDMTNVEKGELLLAWNEGREIEAIDPTDPEDIWECHPEFEDRYAYRVKPEPVRETVTIYGGMSKDGVSFDDYGGGTPHPDDGNTHRITFDLIDGEPDCDSINMEPLE